MDEPDRIEERFEEILREIAGKERGDLRFEAKFLTVSDIATQYYCEKKVEMERTYGKGETPEMKVGREAHELLLKDTIRTKRRQILHEILSGKSVLVREMLLLGKHGDIAIVGVADAVLFGLRSPLFLFEYKFSSRQVPFRDHHVQARMYCYLLHLMGWDINRLRYALVMAPPGLADSAELRKAPLYVLKGRGEGRTSMKISGAKVNIYINKFDIGQTVNELDWAVAFWKQQRDVVPTKKAAKCAVCEFKESCGSAKTTGQ